MEDEQAGDAPLPPDPEEIIEDEAEAKRPGEPGKLPPHVAGTLCYVLSFASGVVFLLLDDDRFVRFHAFQSILLGAVVLILQIGIAILMLVPPLGWLLGDVLRATVGICWGILTIFLMIKAYAGEAYQLPYIGPRAAKLTRPY